jgi:hypothetical protein
MLQRIQTVWFLLAGIATLATLQLPSYVGIQDPLVPYHQLNGIFGGILMMLVTISIAVVALVAIGLYKTRVVQLRLAVVGIALEAVLMFLYYRQIAAFTQGTPALYSILHILIILFFVLAARGINKDEKLIKDSNRLR